MSDRLLDAKEVAAMLAVPETWIREHTRSGVIPHLTLGRYVRYRREDVLDWLETLAAGGGPPLPQVQSDPSEKSGRRRWNVPAHGSRR